MRNFNQGSHKSPNREDRPPTGNQIARRKPTRTGIDTCRLEAKNSNNQPHHDSSILTTLTSRSQWLFNDDVGGMDSLS
jgi:hypothetical protein